MLKGEDSLWDSTGSVMKNYVSGNRGQHSTGAALVGLPLPVQGPIEEATAGP